MRSSVRRIATLIACCGLALAFSGAAIAQTQSTTQYYSSTNLTSNLTGKAKYTDTLLENPWGMAYAPGGAFWVSDELSGWSTLYSGTGEPQSLQVVVPPASGKVPGSPTGMVYNGSSEFAIDSWVSAFLFDTLDGTIQGWSDFEPSTTLIAVTTAGASYTGLAITSHASGNTLYAADDANNKVDMYNGNFELTGSFTDATIPAGFSVFGIQDINETLYVTFAATNGGPGGYIDTFTEAGVFLKRFASGAPLNQPWGVALAPAKNFGTFSGALLVSNNSNQGTVVGYNVTTGKSLGALKSSSGKALSMSGIWGIEFGGGTTANGKTNQLFYTAGPNDTNGYFGVINFHPAN
jgi:uncharacterized protein (TIGR03118 family)